MDITTIMVFLGLVSTVCSVCRAGCELSTNYTQLEFKHVSDLKKTSVAPWKINVNYIQDREPAAIEYANCTENDRLVRPIYIEIKVYEKIRNGTVFTWCKCPFNLAVGCTLLK